MIKSPCKDCQKRTLGCHSTCGDYLEFRKRVDNRPRKSPYGASDDAKQLNHKTFSRFRKEHRIYGTHNNSDN